MLEWHVHAEQRVPPHARNFGRHHKRIAAYRLFARHYLALGAVGISKEQIGVHVAAAERRVGRNRVEIVHSVHTARHREFCTARFAARAYFEIYLGAFAVFHFQTERVYVGILFVKPSRFYIQRFGKSVVFVSAVVE